MFLNNGVAWSSRNRVREFEAVLHYTTTTVLYTSTHRKVGQGFVDLFLASGLGMRPYRPPRPGIENLLQDVFMCMLHACPACHALL